MYIRASLTELFLQSLPSTMQQRCRTRLVFVFTNAFFLFLVHRLLFHFCSVSLSFCILKKDKVFFFHLAFSTVVQGRKKHVLQIMVILSKSVYSRLVYSFLKIVEASLCFQFQSLCSHLLQQQGSVVFLTVKMQNSQTHFVKTFG